MYSIVGLGNPEQRYSLTRHNIGFQILDTYADSSNAGFKKGKGEYLEAKAAIYDQKVLLAKPQTYMNRSGLAVSHLIRYYKIPLENLLVVLDDLDLPYGTFRFREKGSDGGNKGLRSIIEQLGTQEFNRLRIGIRNRDTIRNPSSYVLSNFNRKEQKVLDQIHDTAVSALNSWLTAGIKPAMNEFNKHLVF
ncbi:MAG: aminoacyl-tRNA hydrolase [bacterium]|nr:aminoacyl-tRNA hydrolase [bacterium]